MFFRIIIISWIFFVTTPVYGWEQWELDAGILEDWEITALEHCLTDYNAWANHNNTSKVFKNMIINGQFVAARDYALAYKADRCAKRMVSYYESIANQKITGQTKEKITHIRTQTSYKNRVERETERCEARKAKCLAKGAPQAKCEKREESCKKIR